MTQSGHYLPFDLPQGGTAKTADDGKSSTVLDQEMTDEFASRFGAFGRVHHGMFAPIWQFKKGVEAGKRGDYASDVVGGLVGGRAPVVLSQTLLFAIVTKQPLLFAGPSGDNASL